MIIYLHGFDSNSPGNHEKACSFSLSTCTCACSAKAPAILNMICSICSRETDKMLRQSDDDRTLICDVGLGGYWAERIDDALDCTGSADALHHYQEVVWDEVEGHKFRNISHHLPRINAFKSLG